MMLNKINLYCFQFAHLEIAMAKNTMVNVNYHSTVTRSRWVVLVSNVLEQGKAVSVVSGERKMLLQRIFVTHVSVIAISM